MEGNGCQNSVHSRSAGPSAAGLDVARSFGCSLSRGSFPSLRLRRSILPHVFHLDEPQPKSCNLSRHVHRQFAANNAEKGENVGCYFYGTEGTFHQGWIDGWKFYPTDSTKQVI